MSTTPLFVRQPRTECSRCWMSGNWLINSRSLGDCADKVAGKVFYFGRMVSGSEADVGVGQSRAGLVTSG
jgi:hypothetical protein